MESSMINGTFNTSLQFIHDTLESSEYVENENVKNTFIDFVTSPISLKCKYKDISVEIFPTKNWTATGYRALYEASIGLTKDSLTW